MAGNATDIEIDDLVARLGVSAKKYGLQIAIAESLTGGQLATALASGEESGEWFRGGIVAYQPSVKYELLNAPLGPVVTAPTARAMAISCLNIFRATLAAAVTGVGGPGPEEDHPAGTVFIAVAGSDGQCEVSRHLFEGEPLEVLRQTILTTILSLEAAVSRMSYERTLPEDHSPER